MNTKQLYCRLCAELKPSKQVINWQKSSIERQKIINELTKLNSLVDFEDLLMPTTVCLSCRKALQEAYIFVNSIDQAQALLVNIKCVENYDITIKAEIPDSDEKDVISNYNEEFDHVDDINLIGNSSPDREECFVKNELCEKVTESSNEITEEKLNNIQFQKAHNTHFNSIESGAKSLVAISPIIKNNEEYRIDIKRTDTKLIEVTQNNSEEYVNKQIDKLSTVPVHQLKMTWKDYLWKCSYCETLFSSIDELRNHAIEFHSTCNAYQCTECKRKKQHLNSFLRHVRAHRKYLHYSCYRCYQKFPHLMQTIQHKKNIHENSAHMCSGCNTLFSNKSELDEHTNKYFKVLWKKIHKINKDNLTCYICKKVCTNLIGLRNHLNTHKDKKRDHICEVCGKRFFSKPSLRTHMTVHDTAKVRFECEICKASFSTIGILRDHTGIHSGFKPFACDICGKCFRKKLYIKNHMKSHTDSYPYPCPVCSKRFRQASQLKNHMLQHTGEKPFACDICLRKFTNLSNRNKHMRRKHGIEMAKKRQTGDTSLDANTKEVLFPSVKDKSKTEETLLK